MAFYYFNKETPRRYTRRGFLICATAIPKIMKINPIIILKLIVSFKKKLLNKSPNNGTSKVDSVAVTISTTLIITNQTKKQSADASIPVNRI